MYVTRCQFELIWIRKLIINELLDTELSLVNQLLFVYRVQSLLDSFDFP